MRIGIDLDNTLIFYDDAFVQAAIARNLLPNTFKGGKYEVREALRAREGGEKEWQALQGHVYGAGLEQASLFPGVEDFMYEARREHAELFIVSHKTEFGHGNPEFNLRTAARGWLAAHGFFTLMPEHNLIFAATREEKVHAIAKLAPQWFIDDLPEVFAEAAFPANTRKILFHPADGTPKGDWLVCHDWPTIQTTILAE